MTKRRKVLLGVFVALLMVGGIASVTWMNRMERTAVGLVHSVKAAVFPVKVIQLRPTNLVERLRLSGLLVAKRDAILTAEVTGKVMAITKDLGDSCSLDEALLRLDAEPYRIAVAQAQASVNQSRAGQVHAELEMKRQQRLQKNNAVSTANVDATERLLSTAMATAEQAEAGLRLAYWNLRHTTVRCPFDGYVAQRQAVEGQVVSPQAPLARLVDTSQLKLMLHVNGHDFGLISKGQTAELKLPRSSHTASGRVVRLGVAADINLRTFPVEVLVETDNRAFRPGQVVQALLRLNQHKGVLAVPREALFSSSEGSSVWVIKDAKAAQRSVVAGPSIDGWVVINSGLKALDQVVAVGGSALKSGDAVEVVGTLGILEHELNAAEQMGEIP